MHPPLILVTNDDGIRSDGLRAAAEALRPLGDLLIVAPDRQWSGAGRSMPRTVSGEVTEVSWPLPDQGYVPAYAIDASPALCVIYAVMQLASRRPALVVAGVNFGENVSTEVTISGTVGAALEAAAFGIPALAVSLEMPVENHLAGDESEDYAAAKAFTRRFAAKLLERPLPFDADVLSINLPRDAMPQTRWQLTHLSRRRYFVPLPTSSEESGRAGYRVMDNPEEAEIGSDIWCLHNAKEVSVTPLSLDLTSRADFGALDEILRREQ